MQPLSACLQLQVIKWWYKYRCHKLHSPRRGATESRVVCRVGRGWAGVAVSAVHQGDTGHSVVTSVPSVLRSPAPVWCSWLRIVLDSDQQLQWAEGGKPGEWTSNQLGVTAAADSSTLDTCSGKWTIESLRYNHESFGSFEAARGWGDDIQCWAVIALHTSVLWTLGINKTELWLWMGV